MVDFQKLEEEVVSKAEEAVRTVVKEAAANEPTIGAAVSTALEGAGVPPTLIGVAVGLVENLLAHFTPKPVPASEPAPTPSPEPVQSSESAPAEATAPEAVPAAPPFPDSTSTTT